MVVAIMDPTHRLWLSVLLQAYQDLEEEEFQSYWWNQAAGFFFGSGDWVQSRRTICDFLGVEPDNIRRPALRIINQRRLAAGHPPLQPQAPTRCLPKQRVPGPAAAVPSPMPLPRLVAEFKKPEEPKRRRQPGSWQQRWRDNPFDPWRELPSEAPKANSEVA
jgi:hypothetical protein